MCSDSNARDDNSLHLKPSDRAQQNACVVYFVIPPFTVDVSLHPSGYVGSLDGGRQEEGLLTQEFLFGFHFVILPLCRCACLIFFLSKEAFIGSFPSSTLTSLSTLGHRG